MSSSAFTPSTTTVTNNVPVNVPVVTAWESYTPTFSAGVSFGSTGSSSWAFRRVGENLQISARVNLSGTGVNINGTDGTFIFTLPTGLTFRNLVGPTSARIGYAQIFDGLNNLVMAHIEQLGSETNRCNVYIPSKTLTGQSLQATTALTFSGGTAVIFITVDVPISQWASSGTTTLATRAVEEYASSTSGTWDADSTAAQSVYGPSGSIITGALTATRTKIVRFQNTIQSSDSLSVEINKGLGWEQVYTNGFHKQNQGSVEFGCDINVNNSTDVQVRFFQKANPFGQASFGSLTGAFDWVNNWRWRVRKVSSGAQVGYPVSARNIVGDTSGSVVPVGMLGETYRVSVSGFAPNLTTVNLATVALPAGVWSVTFCGYFNVNNAILHQQVVSISLTSASNDGNFQSILLGNTTTAEKQVSLTRIVNTTGQNLFLTWYQNGSASTSISGYIVYTRIA